MRTAEPNLHLETQLEFTTKLQILVFEKDKHIRYCLTESEVGNLLYASQIIQMILVALTSNKITLHRFIDWGG